MTRILVINGHPRPGSLSDTLADAYADGARSAGHDVDLLALRDIDFDPFATTSYAPVEIEPDLASARERIRWAEHVVWLWPLWFGLPPALVKAFIERAMTPGYAIEMTPQGWPGKKLLTERSARVIVTMSMPWWFYRIFTGAHATRAFRHSMLGLFGFSPIRETLCDWANKADETAVKRWQAKMRALGESAR